MIFLTLKSCVFMVLEGRVFVMPLLPGKQSKERDGLLPCLAGTSLPHKLLACSCTSDLEKIPPLLLCITAGAFPWLLFFSSLPFCSCCLCCLLSCFC